MSPVAGLSPGYGDHGPGAPQSTVALTCGARPNQTTKKDNQVPRRNSNASERPQTPPLPRITPSTWPLSPRRTAPAMTHAEDKCDGHA